MSKKHEPSVLSRLLSLLGILATTIALTTLSTPPASADGPSALDRCLTNAAPDLSETVVYNGGQTGASFPSYDNPPNVIFPGDIVHVTITGSVRYDLWGNSVGPDGNGQPAAGVWPFPGMEELSSIARWNNNPDGWVGEPMQTTSLSRCTPAPSSYPVRLLFYINDGQLWDNGGSWIIHTQVFRADSTLVVDGVEVTQGVQTADNQVPLLADKRTFVRVYVRNAASGSAPIPGTTASLIVSGESRTYTPILNQTVTSGNAGSDRRTFDDSFLFEVDPAATSAGSRAITVTVNPPGSASARLVQQVTFHPAAALQVFGARYSYYNVPSTLPQQSGWWQARPVSAWEPLRQTAENALPVSSLAVNDMTPGNAWGAVSFDCQAVESGGSWGCDGYASARPWAAGEVDARCPAGGCWIVVLQPEIDTGHHGCTSRPVVGIM